ncbi:MAG TPA: c-type cytochrome [Polyangiales bacterium]|nr:c-type cytochrome [Polyangiales bacterium]
MRLKLATAGVLFLCLAAWACGDDDDEPKDAGADASKTKDAGDETDSGKPDSGKPQTPAERGKYLVEAIGACGDCHTPRLQTGGFDTAKALAGVDCFIDADPTKDDFGCLSSRNLTNHETGLKNRSDQEVKDMFMKGERPDGKYLHPVMPYYVLGNMSDEDADAIVAFLRTVEPVDHMVKANQAPFLPPDAPAPIVPKDKLPKPSASYSDKTAAMRGMYLAANIGVCMECHTGRDEMGGFLVDKLFQGGNRFGRDELGLPPAFPEAIYSSNITPHETGIKGYTVDTIVAAIKKGVDKDKKPLCPPMPAGPMGAFADITDSDARDIAHYLLSLAPKDNMIPATCDVPMGMPTEDGGI